MNDMKFPFKKLNIIIIIIFVVIIFISIFLTFFPALLLGGAFDNPPSKSKVMQLVINNKNTFDNAIVYIKTLDKDVDTIEYTNKRLYSGKLSNGTYVKTPVNNKTLEKIFTLEIEEIDIYDNSIEFFCGGADRNYYSGIIYSDNGNPVGYQGDTSMNLIKEGPGWEWKEKNGDDRYYCEKIEGNWYYYQMWF